MIGEGSYGKVYQYFDLNQSNNSIAKACKRMKEVKDKSMEEFFIREIDTLTLIKEKKMKGFVQIDKCFHYKDTYYVIFEMLKHDLNKENGLKFFHEMNKEQKSRISQYITALETSKKLFKEYKLTNQDIKPDNMMVDEQGNLKIIDLGVMYNVDEEVTGSGSPFYISPLKYRLI